MKNSTHRFLLMSVVSCLSFVSQAFAQTPIENTAALRAFVEDPYFCQMFVGAPNREDGVSKAYVLGADKALESILQANAALNILDALAFIQRQCDTKLKGGDPEIKGVAPG